ncbi:MAG: hypothetical protein L0L10_11525 [Tetragenococcus sp.]|nr:hypothetical protein [Tetragenococcus sp.]
MNKEFIEIYSLMGCNTFEELEKDYDSEIYYADMDGQSVLDNIEAEHMEGLSLYLFDGWCIAFWN